MTVVVEEAYPNGIPQTAVAGWSPRAVAWHWSAGAAGRAGWESTIRYLVATRASVNASYHGGFWPEHDAGHRACRTVIQWIVPTTKAAHSIAPSQVFVLNPDKPRAVQEDRFAEVRRILVRDNDPNADCLALAYAGMPADLQRDLACAVFRADLREIARQLVANPAVIDRPHFGHGWIQPLTRYEMDIATDFIDLLYGEEDPMALVYFKPATGKVAAGTEVLTAPNGSIATTLAGGPAVVLGELPAGAPKWLLILVGARTNDFGQALATTVPDVMGWIARSRFTFDVSPINKPFVERVGAAVYSDEPIGGDVSGELAKLRGALDSANKRTATVKTSAAAFLRKGAAANRDTAAGLEAAAKNVETL